MNKIILMGRLTRDPEINYSQNSNNTCIARYTLAVDRRFKRDGGQEADFPSCVVFGKGAEFAEKYLHKGTKIVVTGRLETGSYTNRDGVKVYTTTVVVEEQEFAESKAASQGSAGDYNQNTSSNNSSSKDGFMDIPDDISDELPFV
jgi:single-strand DNA-binding protein